jgi:hypothetical protein
MPKERECENWVRRGDTKKEWCSKSGGTVTQTYMCKQTRDGSRNMAMPATAAETFKGSMNSSDTGNNILGHLALSTRSKSCSARLFPSRGLHPKCTRSALALSCPSPAIKGLLRSLANVTLLATLRQYQEFLVWQALRREEAVPR